MLPSDAAGDVPPAVTLGGAEQVGEQLKQLALHVLVVAAVG